MINKILNNCRCCLGSFTKNDFWCEWSQFIENKDGKFIIKEPIGFCDFCDKNNKVWYIKDKKCHNKMKL